MSDTDQSPSIRRFVSTTVAHGGVGKSTLAIAEALAIITGRDLLGVTPHEQTAVWIWNGEDPQDEIDRRVMAAVKHYGINTDDCDGGLFTNSSARHRDRHRSADEERH